MDEEIREFLLRHLLSIQNNDTAAYRETSSDELTLYEWWVTPHRIDGLPFHEFMMASNAERGTVFGSPQAAGQASAPEKADTRLDLANLHIQRYGDTAIASYTLLTSTALPGGVQVNAHNESRVMVKQAGRWKVVHVHKSPAWPAPHTQP
ncbi:MAG TPA: nuclear transport factor 2 family protein [Anaerolineales bacterium]